MKFDMILAHNNNCIGLEGVYLEYVKFPMEVENPGGIEVEESGEDINEYITLDTMEELHAWAERQFDGDYEIVTLNTELANEIKAS